MARSKYTSTTSGDYTVKSNFDEFIATVENDFDDWAEASAATLPDYELYNDVPYANIVAEAKVLDKIQKIIEGDKDYPMNKLGTGRIKPSQLKGEMDDYFMGLLDTAKQLSPFLSGLLRDGSDNITYYEKADKRYRDGDPVTGEPYMGWMVETYE